MTTGLHSSLIVPLVFDSKKFLLFCARDCFVILVNEWMFLVFCLQQQRVFFVSFFVGTKKEKKKVQSRTIEPAENPPVPINRDFPLLIKGEDSPPSLEKRELEGDFPSFLPHQGGE